jgi:hypothetical protein
MLKFKGKAKCLKEFLGEIIKYYGKNITLKELIEKWEDSANVCL